MPERFIPLYDFVSRASEPDVEVTEPVVTPSVAEARPQACEALAELRRFHAAVCDAVDVAVRDVLCDVAAVVLARELELAPVNIQAIVARACKRHKSEGIVCVRVHPDEVAPLKNCGLPVVADSDVRRGDALLEVSSGTIDVTLGARLESVLDRIGP